MKKEIKEKMDEHIKQILDKPSITAEDYALLEHEFQKIRSSDTWSDSYWIVPLFMLMFSGFGGKNDEL